jgi:hypothetical protein
LNEHLYDIDEPAKEMVHSITIDLAKKRKIDEKLKATDQLHWIAEMNNAKDVPVDIQLRLHIAVEGNIFVFAGFMYQVLSLHSERNDFVVHILCLHSTVTMFPSGS